jgi:hypothetical protein
MLRRRSFDDDGETEDGDGEGWPDVALALIVSRDRFCVAGAKWAWAVESLKHEVGNKHLHAVVGKGSQKVISHLKSQDRTPEKEWMWNTGTRLAAVLLGHPARHSPNDCT